MARYIDADKIKSKLQKKSINSATTFINTVLIGLLDDEPTADVVEVVRCKDCKHAYINSFSAQSGVALCKFWSNRAEGNNLVVQQDDYCSYGEKRCDNE